MIRQMFTKVGAAVKVIGSTSWIRLGVSLGKNQETFGKKKQEKSQPCAAICLDHALFVE